MIKKWENVLKYLLEVGQLWVLHNSFLNGPPEHCPPLLSGLVMDLIYCCSPLPQLWEHGPTGDQLDHWQSTEKISLSFIGKKP